MDSDRMERRKRIAPTIVQPWAIAAAVCLPLALIVPESFVGPTFVAGAFVCSLISSGLGLYAAVRYPSRLAWLLCAASAFMAAVATPLILGK